MQQVRTGLYRTIAIAAIEEAENSPYSGPYLFVELHIMKTGEEEMIMPGGDWGREQRC